MSTLTTSLRFGAAFAALALTFAACDDDHTPKQNGTGGSGSGGRGTGGVTATGGTAPGTGGAVAGTGGAIAGTGGGGGGAAGGRGGSAGGAGGTVVPDTDIVVARFNADGTPDTTFGTNGIARIDLGQGLGTVRDALWGVAKDAQDRIVLFGSKKGDGTRVDADRAVVRLTANGAIDTSFGTMGVHTLNIANLGDNARNGIVQADGKIVAAGYYGQPTGVGSQTANRIVLARLNGGDAVMGAGGAGGATAAGGATGAAGAAGGATAAGGAAGGATGAGGTTSAGGAGGATGAAGASATAPGTFDNTFGAMGISSHNPFASTDPTVQWGMAEAYGVGRQSTGAYVTGGYGRLAPSGTVNVVSFRFTAAGRPDPTWAVNGIFEKDIVGEDDRSRNVVVLPDDRVVLVGSMKPTASTIDAMIMILTPNGALDTTFNTTGYKSYKFDDRPDEAFYGAAVSPNNMFVAAAGYRNTGPTAGTNDDATLVILPVGGTGTEFAGAVPLSMTTNDRFWGVTFDANNKACAAGFVTEGTDNQMVVARFNLDGTRDNTFGTMGVARANASVAGTLEEARGIVVQSNGKIVIAGVAEHL